MQYEDKHWSDDVEIFSSGAIIVRLENKSFRYLLLKAYNFWDFPKGQVELGESALEATIREV
ncbi:NUDIX domain-containing protein, partial [Wohlfahrtiimonas larvae]